MASASVVVESIPPLNRTTAPFIRTTNSKTEIRNSKQAQNSKSEYQNGCLNSRFENSSFGNSDLFRISTFEFRPLLLLRILGAHGKRDSAARGKLCGDDCLAWRARIDEIVQDAVGDRLIERPLIAI